MDEKILVSGSTLYALNDQGFNRWSAQVLPGWKTEKVRMSEIECAHIAQTVADRAQSAAEVEELRESLALVLPMAKGYARANPRGNNAVFIEQADAALNRKAAT